MKTTHKRIALAASVTLLTLTSAAYSQQAEVEVLAITGEPIAGTNLTWNSLGVPRSGGDGGWVSRATTRDLSGSFEVVIVGDPSPDGSQGMSILRRPSTIGTFAQVIIDGPDILNGQIAYLARSSTAQGLFDGAFLDDVLIAEMGGAIGSTGATWGRLNEVFLRPGGKVFLRGDAVGIGQVFYAVHTDEILLQAGDSIPGLPGVISQMTGFQVSPNGDHWVATVFRATSARRILILDAAPVVVGSGLAVEQRDIDPALGFPATRWDRLSRPFVEDSGRVSFQALLGPSSAVVTVRGDQLVDWQNEPFYEHWGGSDEGAALHATVDALYLENQLVANLNSTLDVDGDGMADPGYAIGLTPASAFVWSVESAQSRLVGSLYINVPGGALAKRSIVRFRRGIEGAVTCPGVPNSTGRPGQLLAFGFASVNANEISLLGLDFPAASAAYALASEQADFVVNAGGSAGNLCLGGSIGRFDQSVMTVGASGQLSLNIDLTQVPGPMGSTAVMSGDEWYFQVWNRDSVAGAATSNFSNAIAITFTP